MWHHIPQHRSHNTIMKILHLKRRNMVLNFEDSKKKNINCMMCACMHACMHAHTHTEFRKFRSPASWLMNFYSLTDTIMQNNCHRTLGTTFCLGSEQEGWIWLMTGNGKSTQYLAITSVFSCIVLSSFTDGRDVAFLYNLACLCQLTTINVYNFSVFTYFYFILKCMC